MPTSVLFVLCTLIWGSTWIAINFQIVDVNPIVSVTVRFLLAAGCLGLLALVRRARLYYTWRQHAWFALAGIFLYFLDYNFLYLAQKDIISGLLAVLSSSVIYFNVFLRRLVLGLPMRREVLIGATIGALGMLCVFYPEISQMQANDGIWLALGFAALSFISAGFGNITSEHVLTKNVAVISMNFYAMLYGSLISLMFALLMGVDFTIPMDRHYLLALLYLAIFGSVVAFTLFMELVRRLGSDKAAYVVLLYPIVAFLISAIFEDYAVSPLAMVGIAIILVGNAIAMGKLPTLARGAR